MKAWSDRPFGPLVELGDLLSELDQQIAGENGQSSGVYRLRDHPGWLFKRLKPGLAEHPAVMDRLIALPGGMKGRDLSLVDTATCWPASRVIDDAGTAGVVFAEAPAEFFATMEMPFGPPERLPLSLDHLVQDDPGFYTERGWAPPATLERLRVARNVLRLGVLLEWHDVVYGDWSYANCLWTRESGRIFLIDMDSCGLSSRVWLASNSWDDPAVQPGERLTVTTDRYKLAVTALRVLTGVRGEDPRRAHEALPARVKAGELGKALLASLTDRPKLRPTSMELLELVETELADRTRRPQPPTPTAAAPVSAYRPAAPQVVVAEPASTPTARPPETGVVTRPEPEPRHEPMPEQRYERTIVSAIVVCLLLLALLGLSGLFGSLFH